MLQETKNAVQWNNGIEERWSRRLTVPLGCIPGLRGGIGRVLQASEVDGTRLVCEEAVISAKVGVKTVERQRTCRVDESDGVPGVAQPCDRTRALIRFKKVTLTISIPPTCAVAKQLTVDRTTKDPG